MEAKDRVGEVLHHIDNQLHLETQAALAFGWGHLTIDEYELHRDAHLRDIVYAKDKDGKPMLAILSEDQKVPERTSHWESNTVLDDWIANGYADCKSNIKDFRRVIIEEE